MRKLLLFFMLATSAGTTLAQSNQVPDDAPYTPISGFYKISHGDTSRWLDMTVAGSVLLPKSGNSVSFGKASATNYGTFVNASGQIVKIPAITTDSASNVIFHILPYFNNGAIFGQPVDFNYSMLYTPGLGHLSYYTDGSGNTVLGKDTLTYARKKYLDSLSAIGGAENAIIGNIFSTNGSTSDASKFTTTTTTSTFTFGSSGLSVSGSPGNSYRDYIVWNKYPLLFTDWQTQANITVTTLGNGIGIGYYGSQYKNGPIAFINSTGHLVIKIDSATTLATSTKYLNISSGDKLQIFFTKQHRALFANVLDLTTGHGIRVNVSINDVYGAVQIQTLGEPSIINSGGSYLVTNWQFSTNIKKNPLFAIIGDSISDWAFGGVSDMDMWTKLFSNEIKGGRGYEEFSIGGVTVPQGIASLQSIYISSPQYALILLGDNDALQGVSSPTIVSNLYAMADSLTHHNITPIFITPTPFHPGNAGLAVIKAVRDSLVSNTHGLQVIDVWTPLAQPGQNYIDTLYDSGAGHPNRAGEFIIASTVTAKIDSLQIFTGGSRLINGTITSLGNAATGGSNSNFNAFGTNPVYGWHVTNGGTDSKNWDMVATSSGTSRQLDIRLVNDASLPPTPIVMQFTATGMTPTGAIIAPPLEVQASIQDDGILYHKNNVEVLNKAANGWNTWAVRNTTGSDATIDLTDISSLGISSNNPLLTINKESGTDPFGILIESGNTVTAKMYYNPGTGEISIGSAQSYAYPVIYSGGNPALIFTPGGDATFKAGIALSGSASGAITYNTPATVTPYTQTDPGAAPSASGQVKSYTTDGVASWVTPVTSVSPPATSTSTGTPGQIAYDSSYFYVCTATNTWVRTALTW